MSEDVYMTVHQMVAEIRDDVKGLKQTASRLEGLPERVTTIEGRVAHIENTKIMLGGVWRTVVFTLSMIAGFSGLLISLVKV